MSAPADYDGFAAIYNRHWAGRFLSLVLPILDNRLLQRLPKAARILDLACGTGQLAQVLTALGYRVTGLDISAGMLRFARRNAPGAEFIQADARAFTLPGRYDAAVSTFDSLNHILTIDDLAAVFRNVSAVLNDGAWFFFDLNTEAGYRAHEDEWAGIVEADHVCLCRTGYDPETKLAEFRATIFRHKDGWRRADVTLRQRCHTSGEVAAALEQAGFRLVQVFGIGEEWRPGELTPDSERMFCLARRLAGE